MIRPAVTLALGFTILTGVLYPACITGLSQLAFPHQANGSLIREGNATVGSELIGKGMTDPKYFLGRASATAPAPYNAAASTGSNAGPMNPGLIDAVKTRAEALRALDPGNTAPIPVELVTASGSGLDPHISPAAAQYQVPRIARARGIPEDRLTALVAASVEPRTFGVLGEPRVNVLRLNRALDAAKSP